MNLNYSRIYYFLILVKHMNMNKAANELFITQPALSLSIAKLEEELGLKLLYRDRSNLILTREAKLLLPHFEQIRNDFGNLAGAIDAIKLPNDNYINIVFSGSTQAFLQLFESGMLEIYKNGIIRLSYADHEQSKALLLSGQADFAITYPAINHPLVTSEIIYEEPIGIVLPLGHPFAQKESLCLEDIPLLKFHGLRKSHLFRRVVDKDLAACGITAKYVSENSQLEYQQRMVGNDEAYCFFSTLKNFNKNFNLVGTYVYRSLPENAISRKVAISYLAESETQYQYPGLIQFIKDQVIDTYNTMNARGHQVLINLKNANS